MEAASNTLQNHNFRRANTSSPESEAGAPSPSADELLAQQQFAQSIPIIEREGANPLWNRALQK